MPKEPVMSKRRGRDVVARRVQLRNWCKSATCAADSQRHELDADFSILRTTPGLCYIWAWSERTAMMQASAVTAPPQTHITRRYAMNTGDCSLVEYRRSRRHLGISRARPLSGFVLVWAGSLAGVLLPQRRPTTCTR